MSEREQAKQISTDITANKSLANTIAQALMRFGDDARQRGFDEGKEQLASWMIEHSFATGHGDTLADLLKELDWQVAELRSRALEKKAGSS